VIASINMNPTDLHLAHLVETKIASQTVLRGDFLHVLQDSVRLPDGKTARREFVLHPGAVMVIALLDTDTGVRVVMERQFRYPIGQVMIELPAGKRNAGEDLWHAAKREFAEETGYQARAWALAGCLHPCVAYSTEAIHVWFARDLTLGQRQLDAEEFLDVFTATPDELLRWCQTGQITDAKTLIGVLWLQNVLSGAWQLDWQTNEPGSA
jgi:ADP-ribose pyrophosphatase